MGDAVIAAALLACAANVAPVTLEAVIRVESGGNPYALNVNHLYGPQPHPHSATEAAQIARTYIARGLSVDIGLAQINSRNLASLGMSVEQALDPCSNVRGGASILTADYVGAVQIYGEGQRALKAALSAYNTGSFYRGLGAGGYVSRYFGNTEIPSIPGGAKVAAAMVASTKHEAPPDPYTATTEVAFTEASNVRFGE